MKKSRIEVEVNQNELNQWISKHMPYAAEKLAGASEVSFRTIQELFSGRAPKTATKRHQIAKGMRRPVDVVFPAKKLRAAKESA